MRFWSQEIFYSDSTAPAEYLSGDWWSYLAYDNARLLKMRHLITSDLHGINDIRQQFWSDCVNINEIWGGLRKDVGGIYYYSPF